MAGITIPLITEFKDTGIKQAIKEFKKLETAGQKAQFAIKKAAVPAAAALGAVVAVIGSSVQAAIEDAAAQASLARQIKVSTGATVAQVAAVEDYISSLGRTVALSDDEARPAFQKLVVATKDLTLAQELLNLAIDVSAATGKDLATVSDALAKGYAGNMRGLQALSPELKSMIKTGASLSEVQKVLTANFGGAGVAAANTAAGGMKKLSIAFNETKESIGTAFLPVFEKMLPVVQKFAAWAERNPTLLAALVVSLGAVSAGIIAFNALQALTVALNTALTASFSALYVATGVVVILAIVAALVALQMKFNLIGKAVDASKQAFVGFRTVVDTVFKAVKAAFQFAIDGAKQYFKAVQYYLAGVTAVFQFFRNDVWGIIKQIVTGTKSIMAGVVTALVAPFKTAFNAIAFAWNSTIGKFSFTVPSWVPKLGGKGFNMPDIPYLADGGIVTGPTLAMIGEKGPEAVIPLSRGGGTPGGNTITINVQGADPNAVVAALQRYVRISGPVPVNTRAM